MIRNAFQALVEFDPRTLPMTRAPHGRAEHAGQPYTHIALRLFEVAGLRLMDERHPEATDLEMVLGRVLSEHFPVVYALYEDETMAVVERGSSPVRWCRVASMAGWPIRSDAHVPRPL